MRLVAKIGSVLGIGILALGGFVALRTTQFQPLRTTQAPTVSGFDLPTYDVQRSAKNLSQAIQFQTISHQNPAENKAEEWRKLHAWLKATYPAAHAAMNLEIVGGGALLYTWQGTSPNEPAVIVMAHQDVVPVTTDTEKDWKYPPFAGQIAEDAVWGRGAVDDKGSLIGLFEAMEALAKQGFKPKRTVYLVSGHDEEVGGNGAREIAALLERRGIKALFTIDEGSAVILDAPLTKAPAILIGVAEKGYATLKVTAKAEGGHSSMPPSETGVVNLAKAVIAINEKPFPLELKGPGADMLSALAARQGGTVKMAMANQWLFGGMVLRQARSTPSGAAMLHTTIAPTMLEGSPKENVLPQTASALINYRIAPWNRSSEIMVRAKSAVGNLPVELSWEKPPREPSRVSSTSSAGWKLISAAAQVDAPSASLAPFLVLGGTDSRNFERISADVYRFMPMHFRLEDTKIIHGTNERMTLDNLQRMVNFYMRLIATSAG